MISRPTLLVLGAGASMPYQFPSGPELRRRLIYELDDNTYLALLERLGHAAIDVRLFSATFRKTRLRSIDTFLAIPEMYERFAELGKAAIACLLIGYENPERLEMPVAPAGHWYEYLWNTLERSWGGFEQNHLRIITFNYDRSLEHFLASAMSVVSGRNYDSCVTKLAHLRIKHIYGKLGTLSSSLDLKLATRPFNASLDHVSINVAASGLRVMEEREQDNDTSREIAEDMEWAERICFLGFSYDSLNVSRLSPDVIKSRHERGLAPEIYGTAKNLKGREIETAMRLTEVHKLMPVVDILGKKEIVFSDADNEEFLRTFGILA